MRHQLVWLFFAAVFLLTGFVPRKTVYVPNQVTTLNVRDNLFVVGEQREGPRRAGFYSFYTSDGLSIGSGTIQGLGDTSISLTCAKEMGWGMAIGGTLRSGNNRPTGMYVAAKWGSPGKELDKSMIKVHLPEIESVLAIGESRGIPVLLGKLDNQLFLMTPKARQNKIEFEGMPVLSNWSHVSVAKWLNEEVFVVAGKKKDGSLRVAKFNAKGELEADVNPKIDCQGEIKNNQHDREPVCKPSEDAVLEIKDLALAFDNSLVLVGNYQSDVFKEPDAWFVRLSGSLDTVLYEARPEGKFGRGGYDSLFAIDIDPNNGDWLLTGITFSNRDGQRSPDLQVWRASASAVTTGKPVYKIPKQQKTLDDQGIVFSQTLDDKVEAGKSMILSNTLLMFYPTSKEFGVKQWPYIISDTSVPQANAKGVLHPDLNFTKISDTNNDSVLEEDEAAFISVLATRSNLNYYKEIKFTLTAEPDKGGITCEPKSCTLKAGEKGRLFRIPVKVGKVRDGEVVFTIKCNGEKIDQLLLKTQRKGPELKKPEIEKITVSNTTTETISIRADVLVYQKGVFKSTLKLKNSNLATPKQTINESSQRIDKDIGILNFVFEFPKSSEYFNEGNNNFILEVISPSGDTSLLPGSIDVSIKKPHLFGYFFGVPDTQNKAPDTLKYTAKDAVDFARACKKMDSKLYSSIDTFVYNTRKTTTYESIRKAFLAIRAQHYKDLSNNAILIFFSSHGIKQHGRLHIVTSNDTIDFEDLYRILTDIKNKKIYIFLDVCQAGIAVAKGDKPEPLIDSLNKYEGLLLFTSTGDSRAFECPNSPDKNGAYVAELLKGISGLADGYNGGVKDGLITTQELDNYLKKHVNEFTNTYCNQNQVPNFDCTLKSSGQCPDIPIFSVIKP